ncbi:MAG: methyltransferase domain-containing protein [Thermodesulfobacteriota bacterium]|nr:methyltransferase domain-containing protein [Thermodesulfobacteriota bacterium]
MINSKMLKEEDFYRFVLNEYSPSQYEAAELEDERFVEGTYYSHVCKTRCFLVYREVVRRLSENARIIDLGFFPGTLIRELKVLLKDRILCYGAGQKIDRDFETFMQPYVEGCVTAELDPFYSKTGNEIRVPFEAEVFDGVIATEVLEHLISPLEMIAEGARILKKGGIFIITTPNVSHIGAVLKLILGRSNYERLDRSPMYLQNDPWRGHIRFYDKVELRTLFQRHGLQLVHHRYYLERGWDHAKWPVLKRAVVSLVDKILPIYREGHFAVFEKT